MYIEQKLIDECEKLSIKNEETYFIFHDEEFYVGDINEFREMPSRFSYYDTNSKTLDTNKRYNGAYEFMLHLEFTPSEWNLGREYDQTFTNEFGIIITLRPNLFYNVIMDGGDKIFKGFFNKEVIYTKLGRSDYKAFVRNIKLLSIIS